MLSPIALIQATERTRALAQSARPEVRTVRVAPRRISR
jgi:hypothetical protein